MMHHQGAFPGYIRSEFTVSFHLTVSEVQVCPEQHYCTQIIVIVIVIIISTVSIAIIIMSSISINEIFI